MVTGQDLLGKKILILTAHPDDESFLAAGTIYENKRAGGQNFLICATLGEKGASHLKVPMSEDQLMKVRQAELHTAAAILGVDEVKDLRFADGKVNQSELELFEEANGLLAGFEPELLMSFGLDGITGHNDHITVGKVARRLARQHRLPLAIFCLPKELCGEMKQWLMERRRTQGHYQDDFEPAEGNVFLPIDGEVKLQALRCYDSQIDEEDPFAGFPKHLAESWLEKECFRLYQSDELD